ncbi:MAG: DUF4160 domain-containing protein [Candidatus Omnitrophica bacterium]|nr:DUF4160 domain-containing protein [Candidatus Omnitrophota bacterium]
MPVISRFFGIAIYFLWRDHAPPHFHARYADDEIVVNIESGVVTGTMPNRALRMIEEWRQLHKAELLEDWKRAEQKKSLLPINPLE